MMKRLTHAHFGGEVTNDLKCRAEGIRVKHWVNGNSVKMYDKPSDELGSPLRVEVTINHPEPFTVFKNESRAGHRRLATRVAWTKPSGHHHDAWLRHRQGMA